MTLLEERVATTVSAAKAKAEFAECIRKAEAGDPVVITRHGKPVVALVRADRLQQLERLAFGRARRGPGRPRGRLARVGGAGAAPRRIATDEGAARTAARPLSRWPTCSIRTPSPRCSSRARRPSSVLADAR